MAKAALRVPDQVRSARIEPVRVQPQKLADRVWLMAGGSRNSVAVEFLDHAAVIEAPLNEERSLEVMRADLYNSAATAPNASNRTFYQNLQRLKLDVTTIVGIHGNPAPMSQFVQFMSKAQ